MQNALKLFRKQPDGSYAAKVTNPDAYKIILKNTSAGLSFRQTAEVMSQYNEVFGLAKLVGVNANEVGKMVRINVAANLQGISDILSDKEVWSFSLAADGSTHQGTSFFDVRLQLCVRGYLYNIHLACVPFLERHSAKNITDMVCKLVVNLCNAWRSKLISVSTDGENTMTGWLGGFITLMDKEAAYDVLRIWCPPHQMDLVIKNNATLQVGGGSFANTTHSFTVHLRKQMNLQLEMGSKCPKNTNRWAHFQGQLQWLLDHHVRLLQWIIASKLPSSPTTAYWIVAAAINPLAKACNSAFVMLQKGDLVLSQQTAEIEQLVQNLREQVGIRHEYDDVRMMGNNRMQNSLYENGPWWTTHDAVLVHIKDQGSWVKNMYLSLDADGQIYVLRQVGDYALHLVRGLSVVQAERDYRNNAAAELAPPVFPQQLTKMRTSTFIEYVLDSRREMMIAAWGRNAVDLIEQEHRALVEAIRESPKLKKVVSAHTYKTSFDDAWDALPPKPVLTHLRAFCGGLATAFANTTSVESDFSILKCEEDPHRSCLMALSVEGIFQTKQHAVIHEMLARMAPAPLNEAEGSGSASVSEVDI